EAAGWMAKSRGRGTFFNASSAIKHGLADGKLPSSAVKVQASAAKALPPERVVERALMAQGLSAADAKAQIAALKSGTRDAAVTVTRDADDVIAGIRRLIETIRS